MEKSEPSLVPEWLKNSGSTTGGGAISHSDDRVASRTARNKSSVNNSGHHDIGWTSSSDKTTSAYFRRSSSSNSAVNQRASYTTSNKNQDTYEPRDRNKLALGDRRNRDFSDSLGNNFSNKFESDGLRRSQSMIYGKQNDTWPKRVATDLSSSLSNNSNGLGAKGSPIGSGVKKATFERDFPSLGAEDIGRIPSPGLSSAIQSLPIGNSVAIGGEKWTSALVEVPVVVEGNGPSSSTVQPVSSGTSTHVALGTTGSLNMAKTVAQGPIRAQTVPQSSIGNQRLEELAIKQSRQLIPVTPSMPKTLAVNTSDKQKNKVSMQHHMLSTNSPRGGLIKGDISKSTNGGKLLILNPVREKNGVVKDPSTPITPVVNSTVARGPPLKPVLTVLEKRPTSQAQSRNDFFNLVRKKSMANSASPAASDSAPPNFSSVEDKVAETQSVVAPNTPQTSETSSELSEENGVAKCNGDADKGINGKNSDPMISEEAEAALLRSMGWEEDSDEGGLTEEEINAFFRDVTVKYIDSKPSLKIHSNLLSTIGRTDAKLES